MLYFDYNASSPLLPSARDAYVSALSSVSGNASSVHRAGQSARSALESARVSISQALDCRPAELVFTSGGTESANLALFGSVPEHSSQRGVHVVTSAIEHPAVLEPVSALERKGVRVTRVGVDSQGLVDLSKIESAIEDSTVLVSVMHASNETGILQPVAAIGEVISRRRASGQSIYFHSDGVQSFGKVDASLAQLNIDLYSTSAHKIGGPKGIGALAVRNGVPLVPLHFGGRHERSRRAGTENVPAAVSFAAALQGWTGTERARIAALRDIFEDEVLGRMEDVVVNGSRTRRLPNTSNLRFDGISGESLLIALDMAGICVSTGSACSSGALEPSHVLLAMGLTAQQARSSVRFSFGPGNTSADIEVLLSELKKAVDRLRASVKARLVRAG